MNTIFVYAVQPSHEYNICLCSPFLILQSICNAFDIYFFVTALWQAHMEAVLAILLATFAGFGIVMCGTSILMEILKWRRRWLAQWNQQNGDSSDAVPPDQSSATTHPAQSDSQQSESNVGNSPRQLSWQNVFFMFSWMVASLNCLSDRVYLVQTNLSTLIFCMALYI